MQEQQFHAGIVSHPLGPHLEFSFWGRNGNHFYTPGKLIIPLGEIQITVGIHSTVHFVAW
jgi:hypothetical protein